MVLGLREESVPAGEMEAAAAKEGEVEESRVVAVVAVVATQGVLGVI